MTRDTLTARTRFGGCRIVLSRTPRPLFVVEQNVDGDGKKSPGFRPYVTINWGSASIDVVADFAVVEGFFFGPAT